MKKHDGYSKEQIDRLFKMQILLNEAMFTKINTQDKEIRLLRITVDNMALDMFDTETPDELGIKSGMDGKWRI